MATALAIVQAACVELGLQEPATVFNANQATTGRQMGALLNRVCTELNADYDWTGFQTEHTLELLAPTQTTGDVAENSEVITNIPSTAGLSDAYSVTGTGLLQSSRIVSVDSPTQVTLNQVATGTAVGTELLFAKDTYELPSAFERYIPDTWWDRTNNWRLIGPISPQTDQFLLSGIIQTGPRRRWRQIGPGPAVWRVWPAPTAQDTPAVLVWEYISSAWARSAAGDPLTKMTADDDEPLFKENLLVVGLKAYFARMKEMFTWDSLWREYKVVADRTFGQDGARQTLWIQGTRGRGLFVDQANVQDGNFPGPGFGSP